MLIVIVVYFNRSNGLILRLRLSCMFSPVTMYAIDMSRQYVATLATEPPMGGPKQSAGDIMIGTTDTSSPAPERRSRQARWGTCFRAFHNPSRIILWRRSGAYKVRS